MAKRFFTLSIIFLALAGIIYFSVKVFKNIKVDDFKPAAVIFIVDSSASNQQHLPKQKRFLKQLCSTMDPEDQIKILKVSEDAYLIYEGSPHNSTNITKSMDEFTKYSPEDKGTAYGEAMKKALTHVLTMKKEGYVPAVVVIGDLENEGKTSKQINWNALPSNIKNTMKYAPDLTMMFLYAHPAKLDFVKEKLNPVLGEQHLIVAPEQSVEKVSRKFFNALGR